MSNWNITSTRNATIISDGMGRILGTVTYHYGGWCAEVTMGGSSVLWCAASADRRAVTAALKGRIAAYEAEALEEAWRVARHAA